MENVHNTICLVKQAQYFRQENSKTLILGRDSTENVAPLLQVSYSGLEPAENSVWEEACFSAELCVSRAHMQCRLQWGYPRQLSICLLLFCISYSMQWLFLGSSMYLHSVWKLYITRAPARGLLPILEAFTLKLSPYVSATPSLHMIAQSTWNKETNTFRASNTLWSTYILCQIPHDFWPPCHDW